MPDIFKKIVQEVSRNETFEQLLRRIGFGQEFIDPYVNGQGTRRLSNFFAGLGLDKNLLILM